jgi:hypothetical protein
MDSASTIGQGLQGFSLRYGHMRSGGKIVVVLTMCIVCATTVEAASCRVKKNQNCFDAPGAVNFTTVPDISNQIVSEEPTPEKPKTSVLEAPPITTYTGPTVGVSSMAHAPTVGYYWSLEPDNNK